MCKPLAPQDRLFTQRKSSCHGLYLSASMGTFRVYKESAVGGLPMAVRSESFSGPPPAAPHLEERPEH